MFYVDTPFGRAARRVAGVSGAARGAQGAHPPARRHALARRDDEEDARIAAELLANEKERAEHVMLVDLGRNDLGSVCEYGSVQVDELLQIERYSHVMHIVSNVVGRLREDCDALDLFRAGFPAGTVTGTPKVRAMQLIDELEPVARGFYAGSIGRWSFGGDFDSCITLRSVHVQDGRAWWQASAGIVADSDPVAEYEEVLHKTRIAREVLASSDVPRVVCSSSTTSTASATTSCTCSRRAGAAPGRDAQRRSAAPARVLDRRTKRSSSAPDRDGRSTRRR